jgi:hypothetical protein
MQWVLSLAMTAIFAATAFAQTAGTITGIVVDQSGGVIAGATVTLQPGTSATTSSATTTNDQGAFTFGDVRDGHYVLRIDKAQFARVNVAVDVPATPTPIRVVLRVAGVREDVEVEVAVPAAPYVTPTTSMAGKTDTPIMETPFSIDVVPN